MYNFQGMVDLNSKLKSHLEKYYKITYIVVTRENNSANDGTTEKSNNLEPFVIEQKKASIFASICSADELVKVKNEIKHSYEKFSDDFLDYFDRVEEQLSEKDVESFTIIEKTIKNRGKKLISTIDKFEIEESWNIAKIQEEFYFKLQKNLKDIIDSLVAPIGNGIQNNSAYGGILQYLNSFLAQLGIYTKSFAIGDKSDDNLLEPQSCDDCDTTDISKKEIIKNILTLPYILDDEKIISEGKVVLWKLTHK